MADGLNPNHGIDVITGASGHLGSILIRELLSKGRQVRGLYRTDPGPDLPAGVEAVYGTLSDTESLSAAFKNADRIFHTAGIIAFGASSYRQLYAVNVEGTRNVINACLESSSPRLICVASIEAFDLLAGDYPITEQTEINPGRTVLPYGRTKALAALEIEKAVEKRGLDAITVFPTGFIGPYDNKMSAMTKLVKDYVSGRVPAGFAGGFDFVDARDVAIGTIVASEKGQAGDRYLLSGSYTSVEDLFGLLSSITGRSAPRITIPRKLTGIVGSLAELYYGMRGIQPRYTRKSLELLTLGVRVSRRQAEERLGYKPRPIKQSLIDTVGWLGQRFPDITA